MSELRDDFKAMDVERKERHAQWHQKNRRILKQIGIPFTDKGETLLFRELGKPKVDFYPSTGRWREPGSNYTHSGGAIKFLEWYRLAR